MLQPVIHDRTRWWSREDVILILLLGALLFLPGLGDVPLFERDEARFATAGRTMVESGDYIVPHFNGNLRPDKPPLIYWLQAGVFHISRQFKADAAFTEITARLPSAICSMLTLLVVYFAAGRRFGRVTGLVSAMMTGSACVFLVQSRLSTADASMILFATLAMTCAWRAFETSSSPQPLTAPKPESLDPAAAHAALDFGTLNPYRDSATLSFPTAMLFWIALGLGTLAKGVPIVFIPLSLLTLSIVTGRLGAEVCLHAGTFFRRRNVLLALALLPVVAVFYAIPQLAAQCNWLSALWILVCIGIAMPHLPSYIFRYGGRLGNWGWWKQLRPLIGIPLLLVVVLPWFVAAWYATPTRGELIKVMLGKHVVERVTSGLESHGMPPGFYLATIWGGFWPWSILLIPALFHVTRRLLGRTAVVIDPRPYQFLVAWIIPVWLVLELAKTKLIHYPLPLYIPLAILCADTLVQSWIRLTDVLAAPWFKSARIVTLVIWVVLGVGSAVGARFLFPAVFGWSILFAGALVAVGIASAISWGRPSWPFVVVLTWIAALFLAETLILPSIKELTVSKTLGTTAASIRKDEPAFHIAAVGFMEDSLVFYADTSIAKSGADNVPPHLPGSPGKTDNRGEWNTKAVNDLAYKLQFERPPAPLLTEPVGSDEIFDPPPFHPTQKWILILTDDLRAEFDRQHIRYYASDYYLGLPTRAAGVNIAKGQAIHVSIITNVPPAAWIPATNTQPATTPFEPWFNKK